MKNFYFKYLDFNTLIFKLINYININIFKFLIFFINPLASPCAGAPALKYGDVNTETPSVGESKGSINIEIFNKNLKYILLNSIIN